MPKRVPPLSAKALSATRPGARPTELVDGYVPGLRVRVLPRGARVWSLNIRDSKGVRRRFNVGMGLGLAEARRKAEELRRAVREGADPTRERRGARQRVQAAREGIGTLGSLLEMYFVNGPGRDRRRAKQSLQLVRAVFHSVLEKPSLDIEKGELQLIADGWRSASSASRAVRLLRPCLKWGEKRGLAPVGAAVLEQPVADRKRERIITTEKLKSPPTGVARERDQVASVDGEPAE